MNVLDTLNEHDIRKFRFAKDFFLSRPTLDDYIAKYESGEALPKSKYQIIFDSLFSKSLGIDDFNSRYLSLKNLIRRDRLMRLDELNPNDTDSIISIVEGLKSSIDDKGKSELIPFIKFIADGYDNNSLINIWTKYFNDLNNLTDSIEYDDFDKKYVGAFYHINHAYLYNQQELNDVDVAYFESFLKRKSENKTAAEEKTAAITNKLEQIINKYVVDAVASSDENDDNEVIIKKVLERINSTSSY